jgi:ABC-type sugar transport system substrate-binding protein
MKSARLTTVAAAATVLVAVTGCGGGSDSSGGGDSGGKKTGTIAFNLAGRQIPYYRDLAAGMRAEAKRQGWTLKETFGDQRVPTQLSQLDNLITTRPDAMVVGPIDQEAVVPAYRSAFSQKIPIATVSDNVGKDGRQFQLSYVGHLYEQLGKDKAQWIVDHLGPGGGKVAIIHAIRGGNFTEEQNTGAKAVFSQHPEIELIDGPYVGDFTADVGLSGTENLLARHPQLDAIFYDNDDIALGGVQALQERNIPKDKVLVVGTDGGEPALEAVKKGDIDVTFSLCGYAQGAQAVKTLVEYIRDGKKPGPTVKTPQVVFTTADIDKKLAGLTQEQCR